MITEVKAGQETQETEDKVEIKTRTYKHKENEYSLELIIESAHVTLTTYPWSYRKGSHTDVTIFGMTPDNIKVLGQTIIEAAIKIEIEAK